MNNSVKLSDLGTLDPHRFCDEIDRILKAGEIILAFFQLPDSRLVAVHGSPAGEIHGIISSFINPQELPLGITSHPALHRFIAEMSGQENAQPFAPLKGAAAHEVAVGPVHAGVIEPGHFRFQCFGEDVHHLEISLGYQHRGCEKLLVDAGSPERRLAIAETVAGDTSIAGAIACAEIHEILCGMPVSAPVENVRNLLLALELIANHVGDLGALAGDVAFLPTASFCGRIRGEYLNMTAEICGNRFGRNAIGIGGTKVGVTAEKAAKISAWTERAKRDLDNALQLMFESPSVCDRLEGTGVVSKKTCKEIGMVGMAARASMELNGDVLSRALVRRTEIEEAHQILFELLKKPLEESVVSTPTIEPPPDTIAISVVNAWRGPLVHVAVTDTDGFSAYKIYDPSFHNWFGLAQALRGEQISNFPICNKSFNLSYCGTDR